MFGEVDDLDVLLPVHLVPIDESPVLEFVQELVDVHGVEGQDGGLDSRRAIS